VYVEKYTDALGSPLAPGSGSPHAIANPKGHFPGLFRHARHGDRPQAHHGTGRGIGRELYLCTLEEKWGRGAISAEGGSTLDHLFVAYLFIYAGRPYE
jgi:hypothetical protein